MNERQETVKQLKKMASELHDIALAMLSSSTSTKESVASDELDYVAQDLDNWIKEYAK